MCCIQLTTYGYIVPEFDSCAEILFQCKQLETLNFIWSRNIAIQTWILVKSSQKILQFCLCLLSDIYRRVTSLFDNIQRPHKPESYCNDSRACLRVHQFFAILVAAWDIWETCTIWCEKFHPCRKHTYIYIYKVKAIPLTGRGCLKGCEMLRITHCLENRLIDGGKAVSLTHRPHFTPQKHYYFYVSATHFC
jgi:hypothetical protein